MRAILDRLADVKNSLRPDIFARSEIAGWVGRHLRESGSSRPRVLDIGLGGAEDLAALESAAGTLMIDVLGIECNPKRIAAARAQGIEVHAIDIESERIPVPDASLDVVTANHVIEHLKEVFFFFSEVSRVLKPGGIAIVGFPNLGAWHNRVALLFGAEPPCMRMLGSHVRGITIPGFRRFIEFGGFFAVERVQGRAFYLLPRRLGAIAGSAVPGLAAAVHFVLRRTNRSGTFIEVLDMGIAGVEDTPYRRSAAPNREPASLEKLRPIAATDDDSSRAAPAQCP
jgi:SAM-dependent methyltransferase